MPADAGVLSVEFKVNLLAPAIGDRLLATGRVVKAGRTLTTCLGEVHAERSGHLNLIAIMQATMMTLVDRKGVVD
jgi:acyl-coenzyme A thioesterase PaaI-like protein